MKYKLIEPTIQDGKFVYQFTKEELEKLLDEVYNEGFYEGASMSQTKIIKYPVNDPNSTGYPQFINPYVTWQGPNDVPPSCTDGSSYKYSTATTTAYNNVK